jgi:hypothetical protein
MRVNLRAQSELDTASNCRPAGSSTDQVPAYRCGLRRRVGATCATSLGSRCRSLTARHRFGRGGLDRSLGAYVGMLYIGAAPPRSWATHSST